jgi:5'-3' exonuclease
MKQEKKPNDTTRDTQKSSEGVNWSDPLTSFKEEVKLMSSQETNLENYSVFSHDIYNYKEKYYREKFRIEPRQFMHLRRGISVAYVEALSWINHYYYKGVVSWSWFYPYHYSPFFSDIFVEEEPTFDRGIPFKPFEQLMAVLPPKTC